MGRIKNYLEIRDLRTAQEHLGVREERKLGNNTYLRRNSDGSVSVRLFQTDIVTFWTDGTVSFTDGGWDTVVTRDRINEHLPKNLILLREKGKTWLWNGTNRSEWTGAHHLEGVHA